MNCEIIRMTPELGFAFCTCGAKMYGRTEEALMADWKRHIVRRSF